MITITTKHKNGIQENKRGGTINTLGIRKWGVPAKKIKIFVAQKADRSQFRRYLTLANFPLHDRCSELKKFDIQRKKRKGKRMVSN